MILSEEDSMDTRADLEDDLYSGFNDAVHPALDTRNLQNDESFQDAVLKSSYGRRGFTGKRIPGPSRMGTAGFQRTGNTPQTGFRRPSTQSIVPATGARPLTAVRGAGFTSARRSVNAPFDPLNQAKTLVSNFQQKDDSTPEAKVKFLDKKINSLLEESILASHRQDFKLALEKAKDAVAKEKSLVKQKERLTNSEGISSNVDLTFAVQFNLASQFTKNEMFNEALNTYTSIVKNRSFTNSGRIKVNIGNIYFLQGQFAKAIKFYRMALDQVANTQKDLRMRIMKNIGIAFVKLNQFTDAITSFEYIMSEKGDHRTALHLNVCHFALGDRDGMKKSFVSLLELQSKGKKSVLPESLINVSLHEGDEEDPGRALYLEAVRSDKLRIIEQELKMEKDWCILMSAKLIAPAVGDTLTQGYEWTVEQIRIAGHLELANDLEINKAVKHLKKREFEAAIETLKSFEKKDSKAASTAATNLSFLYLLQNEITQAEKYANEAVESDRFNTGALVNKGNCCFKQNELLKAQEFYREALNTEGSCVEALYNFVLVSKRLGQYERAIDSAVKLNYIIKGHPYNLYQMANLHELLNERDQSLDWYQKLLAFVSSDATLLNKMSDVADAERDKHQALSYLSESYRYFPSHIPTLERLAAHYIENQVYEKAIRFLEKASIVQPTEIKWHLMIAACYRRSGHFQQALQTYNKTHKAFPDNIECLKFLIRLCHDLELPEGHDYMEKLRKLEKAREMDQRTNLRTSSRTSKRSATSSREGSASSNSSGYITESSRMNGRRSVPDLDLIQSQEDLSDDLEKEREERPQTSWGRKKMEDEFDGDEVADILPD